ncbi:MAG: endonuclease/exonuclease/phosphatase family protein [Pirellulales bacterium]|nr:endonuclease/exonuclease/phosphatase family protein [Pirellulales bacterium]
MRRLFPLLIAALVGGGGYFLQKYEIKGLDQVVIRPRGASGVETTGASWTPFGGAASGSGGADATPPPPTDAETIRVASFNIQVFGTSKLKKQAVMQTLADIVRRFDVVAIQEVRSTDDNVLPMFVDLINSTGRRYDFAIGPRLGRTNSKEQYAFVFDTARIEIDRGSIYTVADPDDLLHREPLVAAFRARGPSPEQAFTFTLVNIHTDPDEVRQEMNVLDDVLQAVRNDGRGEDDVILLGDLNTDDAHLYEVGQISSLMCALSQTPTNTRGNRMYDNIIFDRWLTTEFDGRSGVLTMQSEYHLSMEQALEVSDHQPIWAQFSVYEGGRRLPLAARPGQQQPAR